MALKNINNAFEDPRLKGKLQVELIAFGDGTEVYKRPVITTQCSMY